MAVVLDMIAAVGYWRQKANNEKAKKTRRQEDKETRKQEDKKTKWSKSVLRRFYGHGGLAMCYLPSTFWLLLLAVMFRVQE